MKRPVRSRSIIGALFWALLLMACASGYNRPANDYYNEGLLFYDRMEYTRSVESFTKVLELAPYGKDNHLVHYNRGMAYFKQRSYDKAVYDFTKAMEIAPGGSGKFRFDCLEARANAHLNAARYDQAIADIAEALALFPRHERVKYLYNNRAWAWVGKSDLDAAVSDFSQALSKDPQFDLAYFGRASVWYQKADYERALADAKEALKLKPSSKKYDDLVYEIKAASGK